MKNFWIKFFAFIAILYLGNPISKSTNAKIIIESKGTKYYKIKKALLDSTSISIWGNSTSLMSFDGEIISNHFKKDCYNYGIEGAFYHQLIHLKAFNKLNKGKLIILVLNPFEFHRNIETKISTESLYLPFKGNPTIDSLLDKREGFNYSDFGWNIIFNYDSEHWKHILGGKNKIYYNAYGNIKANKPFKNKNDLYSNPTFSYSQKKINQLNQIISQVNEKNELVIVIPPCYKDVDFKKIKLKINGAKILDFSNQFIDLNAFQDHIHINAFKMKELTDSLCTQLDSMKIRFFSI